jgi:hypothetical protein
MKLALKICMWTPVKDWNAFRNIQMLNYLFIYHFTISNRLKLNTLWLWELQKLHDIVLFQHYTAKFTHLTLFYTATEIRLFSMATIIFFHVYTLFDDSGSGSGSMRLGAPLKGLKWTQSKLWNGQGLWSPFLRKKRLRDGLENFFFVVFKPIWSQFSVKPLECQV